MKSISYQQRFAAVFQHAPHGMCITRLEDGKMVEVNRAFVKLFGFTRSEVINHTSESLNLWVNRQIRDDLIQQLMSGIQPKPLNYRFRTKKGKIKDGIVTGSLMYFEHEPYILFETFDNTERKIIEREKDLLVKQIQSERNRIYDVLDQMPVGVIIVEAPTGKIIYSNPQVEKILKRPPTRASRLEEYRHFKAFHQNGRAYKFEEFPLTRSLLHGQTVNGQEMYIIKGDETRGVISVSSAPIRDDRGAITAAVVVDVDITKQKQLEQQKDEFIGVASHELRTPITSIKAFTQVLTSHFESSKDQTSLRLLHKLDHQLNKLTFLIQNMLDVSRIEAHKFKLNNTRYSLDALVKEIIEEIQLITSKHKFIYQGESDVTVYGDRERVGQVITNILTNAVKFTPQTSDINVKLEKNHEKVAIQVKDSGIGIPKNKLRHIFERFYRVTGNGYDTMPGIGLGLYISKEIIKNHHGDIKVTSKNQKGSVFTITLPIDVRDTYDQK